MANLEGMPIGSLPEATSIQDEDEIVVYRPSTGKAYQANTDLIDTSQDISSSISLTGEGASIVGARYKAGWVYIQLRYQVTTTSTEVIGTVAREYRPSFNVRGFAGIHSTSGDANKILDFYVTAGGSLNVWCNSALNAAETFTVIYPL